MADEFWTIETVEEAAPALVVIDGLEVGRGSRVRLRPRPGGDIMDLALAGKLAVVEAIERDYEGNLAVAVVVEDDPGMDLGLERQPGHRFFFSPAEIEPAEGSGEGAG